MKGRGVSKGIGIAKAFLLQKKEVKFEKLSSLKPSMEMKRFDSAVEKFIDYIEKQKLDMDYNPEMLNHQIAVLKDPEIYSSIKGAIHWDGFTAEFSVAQVFENFCSIYGNVDSWFQRVQNLKDIKERLLEILTGYDENPIDGINEPCILVAYDLTTADMRHINKKYVKAIVTQTGAYTSHPAIMSRALELPAVLGVDDAMTLILDGDMLIVDGGTGKIILNPAPEEIEHYQTLLQDMEIRKQALQVFRNKETITADGHKVTLLANINSLKDLESAISNNAEGIGLFRAECLFIDREHLPSENEQFETFKKSAEAMKGKPVTIRTLDIGGDKEIPSLSIIKESNPFLGFRGIRMCLGNIELFTTQLRAMLRASAYGNIRIMLPMVTCIEEFRQASNILEELKTELLSNDIPFNKDIQLGVMIETPAAALMSDIFAKEADFISIGTNDLTQYTLAVDRSNIKVAYLYEVFNPAVMRLISNIITAGKQAGKTVTMCGEAASYPELIPFLIASGLDELSMTSTTILSTRMQISSLNKKDLEKELIPILSYATTDEVKNLLAQYAE